MFALTFTFTLDNILATLLATSSYQRDTVRSSMVCFSGYDGGFTQGDCKHIWSDAQKPGSEREDDLNNQDDVPFNNLFANNGLNDMTSTGLFCLSCCSMNGWYWAHTKPHTRARTLAIVCTHTHIPTRVRVHTHLKL